MDAEQWKPIPGYEGMYNVSRNGDIVSEPMWIGCGAGQRLLPGRVLKQSKDRYPAVSLYRNGVERRKAIHRIVAEAWLPNPECKPQVNHKNGITADNRAENLEWCDQYHNMRHCAGVLKKNVGEIAFASKLTWSAVDDIRARFARGETGQSIAARHGVTITTVSRIKLNKSWIYRPSIT